MSHNEHGREFGEPNTAFWKTLQRTQPEAEPESEQSGDAVNADAVMKASSSPEEIAERAAALKRNFANRDMLAGSGVVEIDNGRPTYPSEIED